VSGPVITDTTCGAFRRLRPESLQPGRMHRFVVGEDTAVRVLTQDEAARELCDPQIAGAVNDAAATGAEISLQDPMGLYIDGLLIGGMATPDGEDPATFWTIERGTAEHTLRASYAVPADRGYRVGDITADGRRIQFGAQLADRVAIRLTALVRPAAHRLERLPCGG
jgi:hypothetical protein